MSIEVNPKAIVATLDATLAERDKLKAENAELRAGAVKVLSLVNQLASACEADDPAAFAAAHLRACLLLEKAAEEPDGAATEGEEA